MVGLFCVCVICVWVGLNCVLILEIIFVVEDFIFLGFVDVEFGIEEGVGFS